MKASAIRGVLIVAAVVLGGVLIANAFPGTAPTGPGGHRTHSPKPSPSASPSPQHHAQKCGSTEGIRVAVENATSTAGLAAATAARIQAGGYTINADTDIGNAPTESQTTTVYFQGEENMANARCLKKKFFDTAAVKSLPPNTEGIEADVDLAVYVGADYAAAHPVT